MNGKNMIESVIFLSREQSKAYLPCSNEAMISITEPDGEPVVLSPRWLDGQVLRMAFHDVDIVKHPEHQAHFIDTGEYILMTQAQAKELVAFVRTMHERGVSRIVVACLAGISRSAGIARAIAKEYQLPFSDSYSKYNQHIERLVWEAFQDTSD